MYSFLVGKRDWSRAHHTINKNVLYNNYTAQKPINNQATKLNLSNINCSKSLATTVHAKNESLQIKIAHRENHACDIEKI